MIEMMRDIVLERKTFVVLERITWIIGDNDNEFGISFEVLSVAKKCATCCKCEHELHSVTS